VRVLGSHARDGARCRENWTALKLAAQVRLGGLREVEAALGQLLVPGYVTRLPTKGEAHYVIHPRGYTALQELDES
jgi:hypothetical protein